MRLRGLSVVDRAMGTLGSQIGLRLLTRPRPPPRTNRSPPSQVSARFHPMLFVDRLPGSSRETASRRTYPCDADSHPFAVSRGRLSMSPCQAS
jgi:hypothetical protein